ncbi:MAG: hypothetical protein K8R88_00115 [Armatimonadetes bacterium]|nr:hypothetical protein [Armatimonadota bacterium]
MFSRKKFRRFFIDNGGIIARYKELHFEIAIFVLVVGLLAVTWYLLTDYWYQVALSNC